MIQWSVAPSGLTNVECRFPRLTPGVIDSIALSGQFDGIAPIGTAR